MVASPQRQQPGGRWPPDQVRRVSVWVRVRAREAVW